MSREAVLGALTHISVFLAIPILRSANLDESIKLMILAGKQQEKCKQLNVRKVYLPFVKKKINNTMKLKLQIIQNIPGIGTCKANAILEKFGTLNKLFNSDIDALQEIEGIGEKIAKDIYNLMNG